MEIEMKETGNPYEKKSETDIGEVSMSQKIGGEIPLVSNSSQFIQFGQDVNKLQEKKGTIHCKALIATLILWGGIILALVLFFKEGSTMTAGGFFGIIGFAYVIYIILGCAANNMRDYLGNIDLGENFEKYYETVRNMIGHFWFSAECYHNETRHHTRCVREQHGHERHEHYHTEEKVVTHTANENLNPVSTKDESGPIDRIKAVTSIVFIHFKVNYRFANTYSQNWFYHYYQQFKLKNTRDVHQEFNFGYRMPSLVERKAFYVGDLEVNFKLWFYVFGALGLVWPYCLWVEKRIRRFEVQAMKVLTF